MFAIILLIFVNVEMAVDSRRLAFTYFAGFMKRSRAPQKVREIPIKAGTYDVYIIDQTSAITPENRSMYPIFPEGFRLCFHSSCLNASFSILSC